MLDKYHSRFFGGGFLIAGLVLFLAFFALPSSMSIVGIVDQLWEERSYSGLGVGIQIFILALSLFSCYMGMRYLLHIQVEPMVQVVHFIILLALCLLALFAFFFLQYAILDQDLSITWTGYFIGLLTNISLLVMTSTELYSAVRLQRNYTPEDLNDLNEQEDSDLTNDELEALARKRQLTKIQALIYSRYLAYQHQPWRFSAQPIETVTVFHPIPYRPMEDDWLILREPWRVVFEMYRSGYEETVTLGVDIYGDVLLGRGQDKPVAGQVLLDLTPYDAARLGVSRQHMMLRPTGDALYIIDMGSRYGTKVNEEPIPSHTAVKLDELSRISLGNRVIIVIHVIRTPKGIPASQPPT